MWIKVIEKSYEHINRKILLLALGIFFLFLFLVLPGEGQRSQNYFGGSPTPDTSFIYSGDDLYQMASDFGQEGRAYYIRSRFTFDVFWPMAYGFFLWAAIAYFGKPFRKSACRFVLILPFLGVALDVMENMGASWVMWAYPDQIPLLLWVIPIFTLSKWLVIGSSFITLVLLVIASGFRWIKK